MFKSTRWEAIECPDGVRCVRGQACHFSHTYPKRKRDEHDSLDEERTRVVRHRDLRVAEFERRELLASSKLASQVRRFEDSYVPPDSPQPVLAQHVVVAEQAPQAPPASCDLRPKIDIVRNGRLQFPRIPLAKRQRTCDRIFDLLATTHGGATAAIAAKALEIEERIYTLGAGSDTAYNAETLATMHRLS
eukprot:Amastigsp_a676486_1099.p2 type:complete len:190 gc:universal Amastigsp_a676486_1099:87-656(+)